MLEKKLKCKQNYGWIHALSKSNAFISLMNVTLINASKTQQIFPQTIFYYYVILF